MKAYVLGAGASFPCYPLGRLLLEEIDEYISSCGRCHDRFDYTKEWPEALRWLETNGNPLLRQARRTGNIEQIFTVLDFAEVLWDESMTAVLKAGKGGAETFAAAEADYENLQAEIGKYQDVRRILLRAMGAYFETRHHDDRRQFGDDKWNDLRGFAKILTDRDVVITFNYDSTVERVLWYEKKWTPRDGYGFKLDFQKDHRDRTPVEFSSSRVKVLHLHGSIGWHPKPPSDDGGAVPAEIEMSLDPVSPKILASRQWMHHCLTVHQTIIRSCCIRAFSRITREETLKGFGRWLPMRYGRQKKLWLLDIVFHWRTPPLGHFCSRVATMARVYK